jgi:hypothetical protein
VCGRFTSSQRREAIGERFEVAVPETYQERYNLAPQQPALIVRERDDVREAVMAKDRTRSSPNLTRSPNNRGEKGLARGYRGAPNLKKRLDKPKFMLFRFAAVFVRNTADVHAWRDRLEPDA